MTETQHDTPNRSELYATSHAIREGPHDGKNKI